MPLMAQRCRHSSNKSLRIRATICVNRFIVCFEGAKVRPICANYKLVLVDPKNSAKESWKEIIPEKKEVLQGVSTGGGNLFTSYLNDASTRVYQHSYDGKLIRNIELPGIGTAGGFGGKKEEKEFYIPDTDGENEDAEL